MRYDDFEPRLLALAFESEVVLTPASVAYHLGCTVDAARTHLEVLVARGVLVLDSDDGGNLFYVLPERAHAGVATGRPLTAAPRSIAARDRRRRRRTARVANAIVPGAGTLTLGRWAVGGVQVTVALGCIFLAIAFAKDFRDSEHVWKAVALGVAFVGTWFWAQHAVSDD